MWRKRLRWTFRLGVLTIALLACFALFVEPRRLVVRQVELPLPNWPPPLAGMRVALLSDLHVGSPHWSIDRLRELVAATNAEHPDVVILAGDYVIDGVTFGTKTAPEPIAEVLGGLSAPHGVIAVLGNHDWWNDGERIRRAFEARGLVVLENQSRALTIAKPDPSKADAKDATEGQLFVAGLADAMTRAPSLNDALHDVPPGAPVLVVVHEPDVFSGLDARATLTLAGHTHGGQVKLPILGRPVVPSAFGQRYAAGHVVEDGRHLFVTTGVGTSIFPIRFGVPPELVILTLR